MDNSALEALLPFGYGAKIVIFVDIVLKSFIIVLTIRQIFFKLTFVVMYFVFIVFKLSFCQFNHYGSLCDIFA